MEETMAKEGDIPAYSSDLIDWLLKNIKAPSFPLTAKGARHFDEETVRLGCFQAGAFGLVEQLVAWRQATEENHGKTEEDSAGIPAPLDVPTVFDGAGRVVTIKSPVRVVSGEPE